MIFRKSSGSSPSKESTTSSSNTVKKSRMEKRQKLISELVYEIDISERTDDITLNLHKCLNHQLLDFLLRTDGDMYV